VPRSTAPCSVALSSARSRDATASRNRKTRVSISQPGNQACRARADTRLSPAPVVKRVSREWQNNRRDRESRAGGPLLFTDIARARARRIKEERKPRGCRPAPYSGAWTTDFSMDYKSPVAPGIMAGPSARLPRDFSRTIYDATLR